MKAGEQIALVFPGQGSQRKGMAQDFYDSEQCARSAFEEASEACGLDLAAICFEHDERLALTEFAQPAILTAEIAMARALGERHGLSARYFGGHSLGEYTALVAADALPLGVAARLVRARGRLMQNAVEPGRGRMLAVLSRDLNLEGVLGCLDGLNVVVANDNSPDQVVLSGLANDTRVAEARIAEQLGAKPFKAIELHVSAPFHSPLMAGIEDEFEALLYDAGGIDSAAARTVTSNFTGRLHSGNRDELIAALRGQLSGRVRWRENMSVLTAACPRIVEVGPAATLKGFFKGAGTHISAVTSVESAAKTLE